MFTICQTSVFVNSNNHCFDVYFLVSGVVGM